jgi:hypothetical protein
LPGTRTTCCDCMSRMVQPQSGHSRGSGMFFVDNSEVSIAAVP